MTAPPAFTVQPTSRYKRLSPNFNSALIRPYNRTRQHHIKKLEGVAVGQGQYRLSLGRWRFRFDIVGQVVLLSYCGLRREDTH